MTSLSRYYRRRNAITRRYIAVFMALATLILLANLLKIAANIIV